MSQVTASHVDGSQESWARVARAGLFVAVWCLVWIGLEPFGDLGSQDLLGLTTGNDLWIYVTFGLLGAMIVGATVGRWKHFVTALTDRPFIWLALYIGVNIAISTDFASSLRRYILFLTVALIAALVCLLPRDRDEFARLIVGCALFVTILSYAGVLLLPELAVHQATDLVEARLAGDWRGVFGHKNLAGGVFSTMVFIGIFAARIGLVVPGMTLACLAGLFVVLSAAKSSIIIVVLTLLVSTACAGIKSTFGRALMVFTPLVVLLCLGVGSVISPAIGSIVSALPFDASFTGRTDVWAFALEKFAEKPVTGYGFLSFWSLESTKFGIEDNEQWAGSASNGHNGFLDTALNLGVIGLVLTVIVLVIQPFRNDLKARRQGADPIMTTLFFQLWLFSIYLSCMESFLFSRTDPVWFSLLVAVFGLRMTARFRVVANQPPSPPGAGA
ncbi:O-antigen ligase family protein [Phreatobacter stygius]|uniref:O-antigen ligase family protein n=1 Tax=Phreatobacter stygius TaxID=1940610 RepID=A0A4D7BBX3_9HYPH|nr:O-antigen ligase [Phreatobacter stygius]QCI68143.1 O-antigen ligase family protein [Phreatobacter stygius]